MRFFWLLFIGSVNVFANSLAQAESCQNRILVAATGDIMVHDQPQLDAHRSPEKFFSLWKPVALYIQAADVAYGNLESPVALGIDRQGRDRGDIGFRYDLQVYSGTNMLFNYHPQVLTDLRSVGFDVLSNANNHALDRRAIGIDRTLDELKRGSWHHTGTRYSNGQGEWFTVTQVKGRRLFWLSCTEMLNGNQDRYKQVLNCFEDQKEIEDLIVKARQQYDGIFLLPHWGNEYSSVPTRQQKTWAQKMASLGVTAIIGNHPHVLQPLEKIQNTWVAYSLGNFSAWQAGVERKTSAILYLDLREDQDGALKVFAVKALPIYRVGQVMYPYNNSISPEALNYVKKYIGSERIVRGADFSSAVLSCD